MEEINRENAQPVSPPKAKFKVPIGDGPAPVNTTISKMEEPSQSQGANIDQCGDANVVVEDTPFTIESARPLDPNTFPDLSPKGKPLPTIANAIHLCKAYGVTAMYNTISKKLLINIPGLSSGSDNYDNTAMSHMFSLAAVNRMSTGQLPSFISAIGDKHQFNPVASWITSTPWDGVDRFPTFCDTLIHREEYPVDLKKILLKRWLISAVAAIFKPIGFKTRGVLVLQGPQSSGKSTWIAELVPDLLLREGVIKTEFSLDPSTKDSVITAVSAWIVELGEVEGTLKKDLPKLKSFLTSDFDKLRRPYARTNSVYPRRTVFAATVNENTYLVDPTGNTRWWTIAITGVNYTHGIDMQQLFAQLKVEFDAGEKWWLTKDEEVLLESQNKSHRVTSVIRERVLEALDLNRIGEEGLPAMSSSQLLMKIGITSPSNPQCKECAAVLREYFGESKRINGSEKWRIPLAKPEYSASLDAFTKTASTKVKKPVVDDDLY